MFNLEYLPFLSRSEFKCLIYLLLFISGQTDEIKIIL